MNRNFDKILKEKQETYEKIIEVEIEKINQDNINNLESYINTNSRIVKRKIKEIAKEYALKTLAKAIAVGTYRNSKIEDVHVHHISDDMMKEVNIDVCNRVYTYLQLLTSNKPEDLEVIKLWLNFDLACAQRWNAPKFMEDDYNKTLELIENSEKQ